MEELPNKINLKDEYDIKCLDNQFHKKCNKFLLKKELLEREELADKPELHKELYPNLNDPNFIIKIAEKEEFNDNSYNGEIYDVKKHSDILNNAEFELAPHQIFVKNFMSFQTPYNSLLLYHNLGTGKTCSAIGVAEEMRDYLKQMGISKRIIIVASPNVQDNFRLQLFDERKLKLVDGLWNIRSCTSNKLLKEINPMNMKGLNKDKVISQINTLIKNSYLFLGYIEFANYIEKIQNIREGEYKSEKDKEKKSTRNLKNEFDGRLIIIDEIHNIRVSADSDNRRVAEKLLTLVKSADDLRLLLLSATPMYNSYKEIVWLLNLMNINDRRGAVEVSDVFDSNGDFKKNDRGEEVGKELLIRKATGYVSFVRGNNPYTFPYRIYPSTFSPQNTFKNTSGMKFDSFQYPKYQMNGKRIEDDYAMKILDVYLTNIGSYQSYGYKYIIDQLRNKKISITTKKGVIRNMPNFEDMDTFGYTLLMLPLEALNIIYPIEGLEDTDIMTIQEYSIKNNKSTPAPSLKEYKRIENSEKDKPLLVVDEEVEQPQIVAKEVEIVQQPSSEPSVSSIDYGSQVIEKRGGKKPTLQENVVYINANDITGIKGLGRMMTFVDSKKPPEKGLFEYKPHTLQKYGAVFSVDQIGNYSSKIKSICERVLSSEGIILIYSGMIDGGLIPVALALEEIGFSRFGKNAKSLFKTPPSPLVDSRTMKPRSKGNEDFQPARYSMITGDPRLSPDNDFEVKAITNEINRDGGRIKVVLISRAGSEGIDFKCIRQVHIMEPWYNMNRIEQIIGRAVRNSSHKELEFEKRNVEIFMYGTILEDKEEESADLYVYRVAEYKAIQMGRVGRVLKETAVDCIVHHDQTNFIQKNFEKIPENANVKQILPNGTVLEHFKIGDIPYSADCDYMEDCQYKCYPNKDISETNMDTYNEAFIVMNSDKIIQKIRMLMKERFFYKKNDLIRLINIPKPYPTVQIYSALTQVIEDTNEVITDKYGRTGYLVNIGEYYLFQPSELNNKHISIFERSVPIDYKHSMIHIDVRPNIDAEKQIQQIVGNIDLESDDKQRGDKNKLIREIQSSYDLTMKYVNSNEKIARGDDNWYKHCGVTITKLMVEEIINIKEGEDFLIEHIVDLLSFEEKLSLLNIIYPVSVDALSDFERKVRKYLESMMIQTKRFTAIILYSSEKQNIMIYNAERQKWQDAEAEDEIDVIERAKEVFVKPNYNNIIGFIDYERKGKFLVFKYKYTDQKRNTGARCDNANKKVKIQTLNDIMGYVKYNEENTNRINESELCSLQEFLLRKYNKDGKNGNAWFLSMEMYKWFEQ
jgi:superfamily II DNA or RNA helicase